MADETNSAPVPAPMSEFQKHLGKIIAFNAVLTAVVFALLVGPARGAEGVGGGLLLALLVGCLVQLGAGLVALTRRRTRMKGVLAVLAVPAMLFAGFVGMLAGMGWGRPLRVRGKQVFPQLTVGADWTQGERPLVDGLDAATRAALEALWLHDAQKEHASVPAFARLGWILAAVGAPADLLAWSQRAALEEVDHARRCFALAAGYGGRSHSVEPMPDLLLTGLELRGDPLEVLATESLEDGCLLEDFNADAAAACAAVCEEPVTRAVLERIAREERSHAEFSWAVLAWTLQRRPVEVRAAIAEAQRGLHRIARPRAVGPAQWFLVAKADAVQLLRHGRVPDHALEGLWERRLACTRQRLQDLLAPAAEAAVA